MNTGLEDKILHLRERPYLMEELVPVPSFALNLHILNRPSPRDEDLRREEQGALAEQRDVR
jgi:hypothetical protein